MAFWPLGQAGGRGEVRIVGQPGRMNTEGILLQAINGVGEKVESVRRELVAQIEATNKELTTFKLSMPDAYVPRREHTERWENETDKFAQLSARQDQVEARFNQLREDMTAVRGELQALREENIRRHKDEERNQEQTFTRNQALILALVTMVLGYILQHFTITGIH